jgi:excisionase family DNA binding protein
MSVGAGPFMTGRDSRSRKPAHGQIGPILTIVEVAAYLRVHPSTIYRLLKRKELPAFRVGKDWRFNLEVIDEWRMRTQIGPRT